MLSKVCQIFKESFTTKIITNNNFPPELLEHSLIKLLFVYILLRMVRDLDAVVVLIGAFLLFKSTGSSHSPVLTAYAGMLVFGVS